VYSNSGSDTQQTSGNKKII